MPAGQPQQRRSDLRLLLGATIGVILGGIIIAAAILAVTSRGKAPNVKKPLPFGLASAIKQNVREGGPVNIAGLSGDDGFWVAIEDHRLVALLVKQPRPARCTLIWKGSKNTFTCDGRPVQVANLARYRSFTSPSGSTKGSFMVRLNRVIPPPGGPPH